jgi:hypothetical protein
LAVKGVGAIVETALFRGSRGRNWYHDGIGQHFADPVDALLTLAQQEANPQLRERVDEVLCRAFLADLRDEYSPHPLQPYVRNENCLAVLDDADSAGTREFLDVLAAQRQDWDPLLIVSAAPTRSPTTGHEHPAHWVVQNAAKANHRDWSDSRATNGRWAALYPLEVNGLTLDEARVHLTGDGPSPYGSAVDVTGVLGDTDKALRFAHRLTSEDTVAWYDIMTAITQAPLAQPAQEVDSQQHWLRLVRPVDDGLVEPAELVAALQLHTDPLGDPGHHLCILIARQLESLAPQSRAFFFILEKAEEFRNCWERWHRD